MRSEGYSTCSRSVSYKLCAEEVGTDHVSDHALRFSSDVYVSMERMRLLFCRNCQTLHPGVGLNGKSI